MILGKLGYMKTVAPLEHHIQKAIIESLATAKEMRFKDLKPPGMESNIFNYHLKQLLNAALIKKTDNGAYSLDHQGLSYVDATSSLSGTIRKQPKLISIFVLQNEDDQWLMAKRRQQPYIGSWMFPSGKQHYGESHQEHASRELHEKFGQVIPLEHRGFMDIQIVNAQTVITHAAGHVYSARVNTDDFSAAHNARFEYEWIALDQNMDSLLLMPGTRDLYNLLIANNNSFVTSIKCPAQ